MGGGEASVTANHDGGDSDTEKNAAAGGCSGNQVTVNIRCSNGSKFAVQVSLGNTVGSFKSLVAQQCDIPAEQQRLIYKGRILKDEQTLESYGKSIIIYLFNFHVRNACTPGNLFFFKKKKFNCLQPFILVA